MPACRFIPTENVGFKIATVHGHKILVSSAANFISINISGRVQAWITPPEFDGKEWSSSSLPIFLGHVVPYYGVEQEELVGLIDLNGESDV